jgi:hypothetical protein
MTKPLALRYQGNKEAVELLERMLAWAKRGSVRYAAVLIVEDPNYASFESKGILLPSDDVTDVNKVPLEIAGASDAEEQLPEVLERFKASIVPRVKNRLDPPPRESTLGADYVVYNVAAMPISYDFVPWLIRQKMRMQASGLLGPLKVGFWFGQDGATGLVTEYRQTMFQHVVKPLLALAGAVEDPKAIGGVYDQAEGFGPALEIMKAARAGEAIPRLRATPTSLEVVKEWVEDDTPIATITLREAEHWRHRNSNKAAWLAFASDLKRDSYRVIFVRDTARADEPIEDWEICPYASVDMEIRFALYELATVNFFVSNGPCELVRYGSRPWLVFTALDDDGPYLASTSRWWKSTLDMAPGDQFPWATPAQRIVWDLDTYENITRAWKEIEPHVWSTSGIPLWGSSRSRRGAA